MTAVDTKMSVVGYVSTVTASIVADALFVWPLHVVVAAGQNAILAVLCIGGWAMTIAGLHTVHRPQPQWVRQVWTIVDVMGWILLWSIDAVMVVSLLSMLKTFYFFETPEWALLLPFCAVVGWGASKPRDTVHSLATFWVPLLFIGSILIVAVAMGNIQYPRALIPNQVVSVRPVFRAIQVMAYVVTPIGVTLRGIASEVQAAPTGLVRVLGPLLAWLFLVLLYLLVVGTLGPSALVHLRWPVVFMLDQVTLDSAFFVSRVGIAVIFGWTMGLALGFMIHVDVMAGGLARLWPNPSARWLVAGGASIGWYWAALGIAAPAMASHVLLVSLDPLAVGYLLTEGALLLTTRVTMLWGAGSRSRTIDERD